MPSVDNHLFARTIGIEMFHKQGLEINRPHGSGDFVFIHFLTPVELVIDKLLIRENTDACIVYAPPKAQYYRNLPNRSFGNNWMHFTGRACMSFLKFLDIPLNEPFHPVATGFIAAELRRINDEKVRKDAYWQVGVDVCIRRFFLELARNIKQGDAKAVAPARQMEIREEMLKLRALMLESCYESWSVDKMAAAIHLSPSRFSVLYKRIFRISPVADLLHMRIDLAKYYLGMMQMSVEDVAESCGFASVYYFHRQFKKIVGKTPRVFQRTYSGGDLHPPHHHDGIWP